MRNVVTANIKNGTFHREIARTRVPIVAVMYAFWCPCSQSLLEFLSELAGKYQDKVKFVKVEMEHIKGDGRNQELREKAGISDFPTVVVIDENHNFVKKVVLKIPKNEQLAEIEKLISEILSKGPE